jgi:hypothetical protein
MAYVLSLRPQSPLKRSFSDNPYLNSCSPQKDNLLAPLNDITARNGSACSLYSLGATRTGDWPRSNENTPPLTSQSLLDLVPEKGGFPFNTRHVIEEPRKRNCGPDRPPPSFSRFAILPIPHPREYHKSQQIEEPSSDSEDSADGMDTDDNDFEETHLFNFYEAIHVPLPEVRFTDNDGGAPCEEYEAPAVMTVSSQPFRRWMSTLRRRHAQRWKENGPDIPRLSFDTNDGMSVLSRPLGRLSGSVRRTSESMTSSMGYVTAMKSASMTIGSASLAPRSDAGLHGKVRLGNRSSNYSEARRSIESHRGALGPVLDESAWLRSLQRRKVVEELIASEEGYIADLKVLINVCHPCTMLAPVNDLSGLFHDPYCPSYPIGPDTIIHTTEYLPDSTASRRLARRTSQGCTSGRLDQKRVPRDIPCNKSKTYPLPQRRHRTGTLRRTQGGQEAQALFGDWAIARS